MNAGTSRSSPSMPFTLLRTASKEIESLTGTDVRDAADRSSFQQRRGNGRLRRFDGPALATSRGSAHDGITHTLHNRLHVGKVAVDDAWNGNDVRDALHRLAKNVIGNSKRLEETCIL